MTAGNGVLDLLEYVVKGQVDHDEDPGQLGPRLPTDISRSSSVFNYLFHECSTMAVYTDTDLFAKSFYRLLFLCIN